MQIRNNLVFGMRWQTAVNDSEDEIKNAAKIDKSTGYAQVSFDGNTQYGFAKVKSVKKLYSAAATFAKEVSNGNGIFVHQISESASAIIVVKNYLPIIDDIVSREELLALISTYADDMRVAGKPVVVYGDLGENEIPAVSISFYSISELEKVCIKADYALFPVPGLNILPFFVAGAVFVGIAVIFGGDIYEWAFPAQKTAQNDPNVQYKQSVRVAVKSVVDSNVFPTDVIPTFIQFAEKNYPWKLRGWNLQQVTCSKGSCLGSYRRLPGGSSKDLQKYFSIGPNDQNLSYTDTDHAMRKLSFVPASKSEKLQLVYSYEFNAAILSWFQQLKDVGYNPNLTTPTMLVPPPAQVKVEPEDAIKTGNFSFLLPYHSLASVASLPNFMTAENLTLDVDQQSGVVTAKIEGKYYVY